VLKWYSDQTRTGWPLVQHEIVVRRIVDELVPEPLRSATLPAGERVTYYAHLPNPGFYVVEPSGITTTWTNPAQVAAHYYTGADEIVDTLRELRDNPLALRNPAPPVSEPVGFLVEESGEFVSSYCLPIFGTTETKLRRATERAQWR
jgi:hypothetical protein